MAGISAQKGSGLVLQERAGSGLVPTPAALAERPAIRECLQWFRRERQWINEQHLALCRIPAATFREQERAAWMLDRFRDIGWPARLDRAGNVITGPGGGREGPFVALTAHLDTVLAPRLAGDITVEGDGRFHGPGVSDNGAGLAALLAIARAMRATLASEEFALPPLFIANVGEEGEGNLSGMRYLCRPGGLGARARAFLVLDGPGSDHVTCRALASRRFEVSLNGPGGHSWSDYGIGNPVQAISRAVALFCENRLAANGGPRSSFNFGTIEGGTSVNSIPVSAHAKVDIRSESIERVDELSQLLAAAVERAVEVENDRSSGGKVSARIREIGMRPDGQLAEGAPLLACLRAVDAYLGIRTRLDCASTDANIPLSLGMAAVSLGAGGQGGGAHTPSEWFDPEGREPGLQRILLTMCLLMSENDARGAPERR